MHDLSQAAPQKTSFYREEDRPINLLKVPQWTRSLCAWLLAPCSFSFPKLSLPPHQMVTFTEALSHIWKTLFIPEFVSFTLFCSQWGLLKYSFESASRKILHTVKFILFRCTGLWIFPNTKKHVNITTTKIWNTSLAPPNSLRTSLWSVFFLTPKPGQPLICFPSLSFCFCRNVIYIESHSMQLFESSSFYLV